MGDITSMLISMGFPPNYIQRAFKVYEKNYGHSYNVEVITEIIVRLQNKDKAKKAKNKQNNPEKDKSPKPKSPKSSPPKSQKKPTDNKSAKSSPSKPKKKPPSNKQQ